MNSRYETHPFKDYIMKMIQELGRDFIGKSLVNQSDPVYVLSHYLILTGTGTVPKDR